MAIGIPGGVTNKIDDLIGGAKKAADKLPDLPAPTAMYDNSEVVQVHLAAALFGTKPTTDQVKRLSAVGVDFSKIADDSAHNTGPNFDRINVMFKEAWSGLWLKFDDITFEARLNNALETQRKSIEGIDRVINRYKHAIESGGESLKAIQKRIAVIDEQLAAAQASGNTAEVNRLTIAKAEVNVVLETRKQQVAGFEKAIGDFANQKKELIAKHEADVASANFILDQKKAGKALRDLDKNAQSTLDKMTDLQSDIRRINDDIVRAEAKAIQATKVLTGSGGL